MAWLIEASVWRRHLRFGGMNAIRPGLTIRVAFTLVELLIVITVMAILAIAALPDMRSAALAELDMAVERLEADIDYARSQSIARPDAKLVLKVSSTQDKYWIANASSPTTPITHPVSKQPYIVQFGTSGAQGLQNVDLVSDSLGSTGALGFDAFGSPDQSSAVTLTFRVGQVSQTVSIDPITCEVVRSN